MVLYINKQVSRHRIYRRYLRKKARRVLELLNIPDAELGLTFVSDAEIARLNKKFLKKKGPTDVLSFPMITHPRAASLISNAQNPISNKVPCWDLDIGYWIFNKGHGEPFEHRSSVEPFVLGDVVISLDTSRRQAKELKIPVRERQLFLIIHGILHLMGYDHVKERDWKKMRKMEEFLCRRVFEGD